MSTILDSHLRSGKILPTYILIGSAIKALAAFDLMAAQLLGADFALSPDHHSYCGAKLGIDDVREIIRQADLRPMSGGKKVFFIEADGITIEAANALLKITEEPPQGTYFFLHVTFAERLPETLRSRFVSVFLQNEPPSEYFQQFLKLPLVKRLAEVKKIAGGDRRDAERFLLEYESHLVDRLRANGSEAVVEAERFLELKRSFNMPASYTKAILEGVAINQ